MLQEVQLCAVFTGTSTATANHLACAVLVTVIVLSTIRLALSMVYRVRLEMFLMNGKVDIRHTFFQDLSKRMS